MKYHIFSLDDHWDDLVTKSTEEVREAFCYLWEDLRIFDNGDVGGVSLEHLDDTSRDFESVKCKDAEYYESYLRRIHEAIDIVIEYFERQGFDLDEVLLVTKVLW